MTKDEFLGRLTRYFSSKGFSCNRKHYYKTASDDAILVFGLNRSSYGKYYYLEYGYCFPSISKHFPHPKFNQLNLNCGRVMTDKGKAIAYEDWNENEMDSLEGKLDAIIDEMTHLASMGKEAMIQHYLSDTDHPSWYILGDETAAYFNLPREAFQYHYCKE